MVVNTAKVSFRKSDRKVFKAFKGSGLLPIIHQSDYESASFRYVSHKPIDKNQKTVIFIHGAPGTSSNFFRFLKDFKLREKANLISVDRLGYGYSDHGNPQNSIEKQAKSIYTIIQKHSLTNVIVVGWSYGVPISAKMAFLYKEVKASLLLAGAVSPKDERYFAAAKLIRWTLTKWLVPTPFIVANSEKLAHVSELLQMEKDWSRIKTPITYIHGTEDHICPYGNMDFMKEHVSKSLLKAIGLEKTNHFILKNHYDLVIQELMEFL